MKHKKKYKILKHKSFHHSSKDNLAKFVSVFFDKKRVFII